MNSHLVFGAAILGILLVVGGLIYHQESILQEGDITILATRPVDPRDLLRGEYVILRYEIEVDEKVELAAEDLENGSTIFVKLTEDESGLAEVNEATSEAPGSFDGLWIMGEVNAGQVRFPSIEQFYVPEGAGKPIEGFGNDLHVEVALKDGKARVVKLLDASLDEIDPATYIE